MDDNVLLALRTAARVRFDGRSDRECFASAVAGVRPAQGLAAAAEAHGLTPLLHHHLTQTGTEVPPADRQQLFAGSVHHRQANAARFAVLGEILDAADGAGLQVLVLKGAALAHTLYPSPSLRPLSDLDLLVEPQAASRMQTLLRDIGFVAPPTPTDRRLVSHHHLPAAVRRQQQHLVQVEIHTDALSRDTGSLAMATLSCAPRVVNLPNRTALTLGHADMLYHLCRHAAERATLLRLIWVADVVGYATRYREEIDWTELRARYPFVLNALSLLHLVTPLPDGLLELVRPGQGRGMSGIGTACRPLTEIMSPGRPLRAMVRDVLAPSDWWLRLHYGVPGDSSLLAVRCARHPARVVHWVVRRFVAYTRWFARRLGPR
jgi:hypothetical protein